MISFCTTTINCKNEFRTFVEALAFHNQHINFEVCVCHDNRVDDGSPEFLKQIATEYPFVNIVENTKEDTVSYLHRVLDWYYSHNNFPSDLRDKMRQNLHVYNHKESLLYDVSESYLWTSTGHLFNKAASIASGDILMFAPCDYIWSCDMNALEAYIIQSRIDGIFYGKFSGLLEPVSNEPVQILGEAMRQKSTWTQDEVTRQYYCYPCGLDQHYLMDNDGGCLYPIAHEHYHQNMVEMCQRLKGNGHRFADMHHGTHVMTRKAWDIIGGFTEEFYGRAWAEDKMNAHGMRLFWRDSSTMPIEFSFNFIKMASWDGALGSPPASKDLWLNRDPKAFSHPVRGREEYQTYLHDGYENKDYLTTINSRLDDEFATKNIRGREAPVVRLVR